MNLEELRQSGRIIFECVAGSHSYGLNNPNSDIDLRGIYVNPYTEYLGLQEPSGQISDEKNDTTYYSLKRFFELAQTANPNIIELLWMPEDTTRIMSTTMEKLIANRDLFISKKCYHTHSGYAFAQIKKCRGQNKKVHNPQPEERPKKEDFCWVIESEMLKGYRDEVFPMRPVPLKEMDWVYHGSGIMGEAKPMDLSKFHTAAVEHTQEVYRLYEYGDDAKGVFRGDDMLVCESIPKEDEVDRFAGVLIYSQDSYEKACRDWKSYHDWRKNRNEARWVDQEKGKLNYDQKNLMHCFRLLMSGENILTQGFPIVRFEGAQREFLMAIRSGDFEYEFLMGEVEQRMARLEELYKTSSIPNKVDQKKIDKLYRELTSG